MKTKSLGFIGGGRITNIILRAFTNFDEVFDEVVVYDTQPEAVEKLREQFHFVHDGDLLQAASQPIVFIALHPPAIMETLEQIKEVVGKNTVVISLAPKITLAQLASKLNTRLLARMIPNATSYNNDGFNPIAFEEPLEKADRKKIKRFLNILGKIFITEESKLESYAVVSAMLPTYFWFQWQTMQDIAEQTGLSKEEANRAIRASLKKALRLYFDAGLTPEEVMDLIPVKPLGEHEAAIKSMYQTKLVGLFEKIKS
ncbi:pyrroline-5-carboxylate reductase family protein [Sunxiuqinia rutila]|uniref:pyrroline-5-carboxylate reductase family protein n=1 Tax=Sunxiuqinia rutila TaxID=1397841 RepID=UPI003D35C3CD